MKILKKKFLKRLKKKLKGWYSDTITYDNPEEIRGVANDMQEIEEAFDIEGYSTELNELADEKESEVEIEDEDYEPDTDWYIKKEDTISNKELDGIFKKL